MREWIEKLKARKRLKKIEKAIGKRMMPRQREIVLNKNRPVFDCSWGRGSGKSITAVVWTLMWRKEPIDRAKEQALLNIQRALGISNKLPAIPDPDATDYRRLMYTLTTYMKFSVECTQAGIEVSTVR